MYTLSKRTYMTPSDVKGMGKANKTKYLRRKNERVNEQTNVKSDVPRGSR